MKSWLRLLLVAITFVVSFETTEVFAADHHGTSIENCHQDCFTQNISAEDTQKQQADPCPSHSDCSQCHMGHCCYLMTRSAGISTPIIELSKIHEILSIHQDIYLPGFHRPPIA